MKNIGNIFFYFEIISQNVYYITDIVAFLGQQKDILYSNVSSHSLHKA